VNDAAVGSSIVGGALNLVNNTGRYASIAGGTYNTVSAPFGSVDGGTRNTIVGNFGAIGGGYGNQAGAFAFVAGGEYNAANGLASFAGGYKSQANSAGSFVWSDYTGNETLRAGAPNEFLARASGGVTFYSNATQTCGVTLAPGSTAWVPLPGCTAQSHRADDDDRTEIAALKAEVASIKAEDEALRQQVSSLMSLRR
jgi:hypothetical protein